MDWATSSKAIWNLMKPGIPASPSYLLLFVTKRCDAACGHCFYWRETNRECDELTLNEYTRLARSIDPLVQLTVTGGSPELRDDLPDIIQTFYQHTQPLNITLCSNGNRPAVLFKQVQSVLQRNPEMHLTVDISIDGLGEDHDQIRNCPGIFDRAVESFHLLEPLKAKYPGLRLGCGICVSGLNSDKALTTASWVMDRLPVDNLTPVLVRGETRDPEAKEGNRNVFLQIARETGEKLHNGEFSGYAALTSLVNAKDIVQKQLLAEIQRTGEMPVRCSALMETAVVYPDGVVPICELKDTLVGSLRDFDMDLKALWRSGKTNRERMHLQESECTCWHQCFLSASMVKSPRLWWRLAGAWWYLVKGHIHAR